MKWLLSMTFLAALLVASRTGWAQPSTHRVIVCPLPSGEDLHFEVPQKLGDLPKIEFDYPSKVTLFSFRDDNFLAVAMDEEESSRVRIVISAQLNKASGTYKGQMVLDLGGNEIQLDNGPVSCRVTR